jgi:hypothetical protein
MAVVWAQNVFIYETWAVHNGEYYKDYGLMWHKDVQSGEQIPVIYQFLL